MTLLREGNLGEVGQDREFGKGRAGVERRHGGELERGVRGFAAGNIILFPNPLHHRRERKAGRGAGEVAVRIAELQLAGEDAGQRRARDDAQLPGLGHGAGQPPAGDGDAHAALDDHWMGHGRVKGSRGLVQLAGVNPSIFQASRDGKPGMREEELLPNNAQEALTEKPAEVLLQLRCQQIQRDTAKLS